MREGWTYKKLWEILIFDKRFNGIPKEKQKKIASFAHLSAEKLKELKVNEGNVRLISTGIFDGYTTEDLAGDYLNKGEIITIPTGGVANIKYHKGVFVDSGNIIGVAGIEDLKMKYVYYYLLCNKEQIYSFYRGVSIKHPYMPDICEMTIPLPSVIEQERIVSELDLLSAIIEKKKEQLKAYDQLAQSIFYDMFGDPVTNEKGWEVKSFGDCFIIGSGGTPSKAIPEYWEEGRIPWIGSNMCQNCIIEKTDGKYITEEGLKHSSAKLLESGTVLVALVGATIGKVALLRTPTAINQNIAYIKVNETKSYLSEYVYYHLMNLYDEFMNIGDGKFKMANLAFIKSLSITCPPLSLQQSFAEKIEAIERQKSFIQQSIVEVQTLFDSRMDYWFN